MLRLFILGAGLALAAQVGSGQTHAQDLQDQNWDAVGILTIKDGSACTATLIDTQHIITAAHCVMAGEAKTPHDVTRMVFQAGWFAGRPQVQRRVRWAQTHPYFGSQENDATSFDLAVLRLNIPVPEGHAPSFQIAPLPFDRMAPLLVVPTGQRDGGKTPAPCPLIDHQGQVLILGCPVDFGASGAPVFRFDLGSPMIVGVISAKAELDNRAVSLASPVHQNFRLLADGLALEGVILGQNE